MKKILVHSGVDTRKPQSAWYKWKDLNCTIGGNSGNLLFADAVYAQLDYPNSTTLHTDQYQLGVSNSKFSAEYINDNYDALVIPAANWISDYFCQTLPILTNKIRKLKIPCIVLGLGAQSSAAGDTSFLQRVGPSARDFVNAVSDKSEAVGVRGEFTASCLEEIGCKHVEITGCPSIFRLGSNPPSIRPIANHQSPLKIAINGRFKDIRSGSFDNIMRDSQVDYICQDQILRLAALKHIRPQDFFQLVYDKRLCRLIKDGKIRAFSNLQPWYQAIGTFDCSIGYRFHGNIISILSGTPALFIKHDSRTAELVKHFKLPAVPYSKFTKMPLADLVSCIDYGPFTTAYPELLNCLATFYEKNGLEHRLNEQISAMSYSNDSHEHHVHTTNPILKKIAQLRACRL